MPRSTDPNSYDSETRRLVTTAVAHDADRTIVLPLANPFDVRLDVYGYLSACQQYAAKYNDPMVGVEADMFKAKWKMVVRKGEGTLLLVPRVNSNLKDALDNAFGSASDPSINEPTLNGKSPDLAIMDEADEAPGSYSAKPPAAPTIADELRSAALNKATSKQNSLIDDMFQVPKKDLE